MIRVEKKIYSGSVLEREFFTIERAKAAANARPYIRFENIEERLKFNEAISRRNHTRLFNANFSPTSIYSTLTFRKASECHTFEEALRTRNNWLRKLKRKFPDAVIFFYMGKGDHNECRIHFHMVSEGIPEEFIRDHWPYGIIETDHLWEHNYYDDGTGARVDHGQDYTNLANYLFDHWTEEVGEVYKHRFFRTRNAIKPEKEVKEIHRVYSPDKPPRTPKGYKLVDIRATKYGYINFKYVIDKGTRWGNRKTDKRFYKAPEDEVFVKHYTPQARPYEQFELADYLEEVSSIYI